MSDAMTDIGRDQARSEAYERYLEALTDYLESPGDTKLLLLKGLAEAVDSVKRGYWGSGNTKLASSLDETLYRLESKDRLGWGRFLLQLGPHNRFYKRLKKLSPYDGKIIVGVVSRNKYEVVIDDGE